MKQLNKTSSVIEVLNELKERYENSIEDYTYHNLFRNATQFGLCNCINNVLGIHNALPSTYLIQTPDEFNGQVLDCYWFENACYFGDNRSIDDAINICLKPRLQLINEAISRYNKRIEIYSGSANKSVMTNYRIKSYNSTYFVQKQKSFMWIKYWSTEIYFFTYRAASEYLNSKK